MFEPIEWGRVNRGRVWHLLTGTPPVPRLQELLLCGDLEFVKEATQGLPPSGGTPCSRCLRKVDELTAAARCALDNAVRDTLATGRAEPADFVSEELVG